MQMEKAQNAFPNNRTTSRRPSISSNSSKSNNANYNQQQSQQSNTFQVPHRRASMSAPYTIPNKSNTTAQTSQSNLSSSLNGSISSPPHTGGPIHTRHYPFTSSSNITPNANSNQTSNLSYQQQQQQLQQQLQQQFQQQFQQAHAQVQAQHNAAQSNGIPMLSREFVVRRISEGESGRLKEELKCEACGKGYKHISSLAKHLWEHTPEWQMTKKLLISKHQQVQLLEAASILCGMSDNNTSSDQSNKLSSSAPSSMPGFASLRQRSQSVSNNNNKKNKGKSIVVSPSPESEPLDDPQYIQNTSHSSASSASPLPAQDNDSTLVSGATSSSASSNPMYTTTIRKNSMSQYPPSSLLSTSLSSTPSKLTSGAFKQQLLASQPNNLTAANTSITESLPLSSSYSSRRGSVMLQVPKINEENGEEDSNEQDELEQELAAKGVVDNNRKFAPRYSNNSAITSPDVDEGVFGEMES